MHLRHSFSFFLSLVFHIFLVIIFILIYQIYKQPKKDITPQKIKIKVILAKPTMISSEKKVTKKVTTQTPKIVTKTIVEKKESIQTKRKKVHTRKKILHKKIKKTKVVKKVLLKKKNIPLKKKTTIDNTQMKTTEKKQIDQIKKVTPTVLPILSQAQLYKKDNIQEIQKMIAKYLYYPRKARRKKITGEVIVKFTILQDGTIQDIKILHSDAQILSRSAIKTLKDISKKIPHPSEKLHIQLPINYKLH